jgi:5-methylcytosine-specific restriction endonuclease McrA
MKEYSENNKEQIKVYLKEFYKDYYPKNRHKYIEQSRKRQQNLANSTPAWLTEEQKQQIKDTYWLAQDLKATTGEEYHVDHIVPLKGENVSGLHVPWNLQVLPADLNLRKSNNVNP